MINENKRLVMTVVTFAGVIACILLVNRWIAGEMKNITPAPLKKTVAERPDEKPRETAKVPRPVVIDPLNDPLAPIIPRKKPESTDKKAVPATPQTSPQKIYEPAEENVILTQ